ARALASEEPAPAPKAAGGWTVRAGETPASAEAEPGAETAPPKRPRAEGEERRPRKKPGDELRPRMRPADQHEGRRYVPPAEEERPAARAPREDSGERRP